MRKRRVPRQRQPQEVVRGFRLLSEQRVHALALVCSQSTAWRGNRQQVQGGFCPGFEGLL